jgi:hypothetical protein
MPWFAAAFACLFLFAVSGVVRAESLDDKYLQIHSLILDADALSASGKTDAALKKYQAAQTALAQFRQANPEWSKRIVAFRMNYLAEKLASLSQASAPATATPAQPSPSSSASNPPATAAKSGGAQVKLIEPGAEPRKALRFQPAVGTKQILALTMNISMDMKLGGGAATPIKLPPTTMIMETTIQSVAPDGSFTYEALMQDITVAEEEGVMPQAAEALKAAMGGLKGLTTTGTVSSRGANLSTQATLPADASPLVKQSVEQMKETLANISLELPEEPVGVGAKWETKRSLKSQGMQLEQGTTYQITSIEGSRITAKTVVVQTAPKQKVEVSTMPGLKLDLNKYTGSGGGEVTLDLTRPMPVTAMAKMQAEQSLGINAGGQAQTMDMKMNIQVRMETK